MKKTFARALILSLILALPLPVNADEIVPSGAQYILPATEGFICDIAHIGGWTLALGYTGIDGRFERNDWGILGKADFDEERVVLEDNNPVGIVPCGDAFVYFGGGSDSTGGWMIRKLEEEPRKLPLTYQDSAFYSDGDSLWYATSVDMTKADFYSIGLDGSDKKYLGSAQGNIAGVLSDSSIVLIDFTENTVSAWKDNPSTVLYASSGEQIHTAAATADSLWVVFSDHFGRVVDGALRDRQEGYAMLNGRSGHQLVFLVVDQPLASEAKVMLMNDITHSYAELGRVPYSYLSRVELREDCVIVWGEENRVLPIPAEADAWTIYQ